MDPVDLEHLAGAVARDEVDYAKANRLFTGEAWKLIPRSRYLGNAVLSLLTKIASGYWHVADSQSGYTAVSRTLLEELDLDRLYPRYGFPNDMLVQLNVWNARGARLPVAADLRRRRAVGDQVPAGRPDDLCAAVPALLVAALGEVRDPRLPPARVLLHARRAAHVRRRSRSGSSRRSRASAATRSRRRRSCSSRCCSSRASSSRSSPCGSTWKRTRTCAEVRPGVEQSALTRGLIQGRIAPPSQLPYCALDGDRAEARRHETDRDDHERRAARQADHRPLRRQRR